MTLAAERKPITVEEFMNLPDSRDFELVNGKLVDRKKTGGRAGYIAAQILAAIGIAAEQDDSGWTFDSSAFSNQTLSRW